MPKKVLSNNFIKYSSIVSGNQEQYLYCAHLLDNQRFFKYQMAQVSSFKGTEIKPHGILGYIRLSGWKSTTLTQIAPRAHQENSLSH